MIAGQKRDKALKMITKSKKFGTLKIFLFDNNAYVYFIMISEILAREFPVLWAPHNNLVFHKNADC